MTYPLSILDLAPVPEGSSPADALRNTVDLARHADELGFERYWLAEHHNMPGIASAATAVVMARVGSATRRIRVGAGGVMLPNHAPLVIAEQFGTLDAMFPGRIDLGLGRAPGTDPLTTRALRRTLTGDVDSFPDDVQELMHYFQPVQPGQRVRAVPGAGQKVQCWILGSSLYGAQLAAALGLPYAFASHFAPALLGEALEIYRARFRPSQWLEHPHAMVAANVFAAPSEQEARTIMSSLLQAFIALRRGAPRQLPPPVPDFEASLDPAERSMLQQTLACTVAGDPGQVLAGLQSIIDATSADELIVTSQVFDHAARRRSLSVIASVRAGLRPAGSGSAGARARPATPL